MTPVVLGGNEAPFTPSSIAGLRLWLKADTGTFQDAAGTTPAAADADPVGLWQDQSGNGYHVSQATAGNKPVLKLAANGINGRPTILFDGTDDYLARTAANWLSTDSAGSVFAVYRLTAALLAGAQSIISTSDEANVNDFIALVACKASATPIARISTVAGAAPNAVDGNTAQTAGTTYITVWRSNGTTWTARVNTTDQTLTATAGANNGSWWGDISGRDNMVVGALKRSDLLTNLKGSIAELLVYSSNLTGADLTNVESYLNTRYAAY